MKFLSSGQTSLKYLRRGGSERSFRFWIIAADRQALGFDVLSRHQKMPSPKKSPTDCCHTAFMARLPTRRRACFASQLTFTKKVFSWPGGLFLSASHELLNSAPIPSSLNPFNHGPSRSAQASIQSSISALESASAGRPQY